MFTLAVWLRKTKETPGEASRPANRAYYIQSGHASDILQAENPDKVNVPYAGSSQLRDDRFDAQVVSQWHCAFEHHLAVRRTHGQQPVRHHREPARL